MAAGRPVAKSFYSVHHRLHPAAAAVATAAAAAEAARMANPRKMMAYLAPSGERENSKLRFRVERSRRNPQTTHECTDERRRDARTPDAGIGDAVATGRCGESSRRPSRRGRVYDDRGHFTSNARGGGGGGGEGAIREESATRAGVANAAAGSAMKDEGGVG